MTYTLQDLVLAVSGAARDLLESTTTDAATTTTTLRDTSLKQFSVPTNFYAGSDLLIKNGAAGFSGANPRRVTAFSNTTGDLTFNGGVWGTGSAPAGTAYALLNVGGLGHPYQAVTRALDQAFSALNLRAPVAPDSTLVITADVNNVVGREYTVPAGIDWLYRVDLVRDNGTGALIALTLGSPGRLWGVHPGTRTLWLRDSISLWVGDGLMLYGESVVTRPAALTDSVDVNLEVVVNTALEYLLRDSKDRDEQTLVGNLYSDRLRTANTYRRPSTVRVG